MTARRRPEERDNSPAAGGRTVAPARIAAFEILRRVEDDGAYASVLLAADDKELRPDDRALCYELVMGVLRWQLWLDALIGHFANRPVESLDKPVRRALRIGLYELRFLTRIPAPASVNQAVNLAYHARVRSAAGFVNAVLRRAIRENEYDPLSEVTDPIERVSIATSHPVWLIERWTRAFGLEIAAEFARVNNEAPPVAIRINSLSIDEESVLETLRESGAKVTPSKIAYGAWRVEGPSSVVRRLADDGRIYLQDEASQLVAHVLDARPGDRILDVCAAPGGKTTHIASLVSDASLIVAGDIYSHRLRTLLKTGMRLCPGRINAVVHDATAALPFHDQSFDRILVDAPCSGTGTLRRNPEIRWRISAEDISNVVVEQTKILANSAVKLRRGGKLVYSTCSIETDENENVVEAFLQSHDEFNAMPVRTDGLSRGAHGSVRTWPQKDGADGFFIAAFSRST